ncbi:putative T7SS-secreted protein, partial [Streptomyces sp. NPDC020362]
MGLGDLTNSVVGGAEGLIDDGKKLVGKGVDKATDLTGDVLDKVGAHKYADLIRAGGDYLASDLDATPGEKQLGETDLAFELIHGNPQDIQASAKHLKDFHTAFDKVGQGMRKLDSSSWQGEAADAFRKKFAPHPVKWLWAADACHLAAGALDNYADTVTWAQKQAQDAIDLYKKGVQASKDAAEAYNKKVDAYNAKVEAKEDPGPKPDAFHDPGTADIKAATEKLAAARKQRNTVAGIASDAVDKALAHAPAEPPPLTRLQVDGTDGLNAFDTESVHFAGGVVKGTAGLIDFARGLNPTDPYNLTHPAAFLQNTSMTLAGLVSSATHPDRTLKTTWDEFRKDPTEFTGRAFPQALGLDGLGFEAGAARKAAMEGAEARGAGAVGRGEAGAEGASANSAADTARSNPGEHDNPSPGSQVEKDPTDPVDLTTGKMYLPQTDVTLPGVLPLVFKRRVESGYRFGRWFGPSWSSTIDQRLEIDSEGVVFVTEDGMLLAYPHPAPGLPTLPSHGPRRPLDRVDGGYTITDPGTRRTWHFADRTENLAVLEQMDDRNGNWITFEYDTEGTPLRIVSSAGHGVRISTEADRVTALHLVTTGQELKRYGYTEGNLTEVVNSSGLPLRFTYDEAGRVTSWTDTNDRGYSYEYDDQDRCIAEGGTHGHMTLRLSYDETDPETGLRVTTATTAEGHTRRYVVDDHFQVVAEI